MNVLVTGADGFIGRRLCQRLIDGGHKVATHSIQDGDIARAGALDAFHDVEHVFHLAARTFVPDSWTGTHACYQTNVLGTVTALELCRRHHANLTFMSTYVYNEPQYMPVDEKHPVSAASPYHETKILGEQLCEHYADKFDIRCTVLRPFNVYGKGQASAFLLPTIAEQLFDPEIAQIMVKDLSPKRDYVYVEDVVSAIQATISPISRYDVFNIGSGVSTSVEEVIRLFQEISGIPKPYVQTNEVRHGEISDCVADIAKMKALLNLQPSYSLREGLSAWFEEERWR
jgi:nucleoside-diphosphate-sugar epimerase